MVATHTVKKIGQFHTHLTDFDSSQHLLELDLYSIGYGVLFEDVLEEETGIRL
jgi:hypothetical protein